MHRIWAGREKKVWTLILWIGSVAVYSARTSISLCVPKIEEDLQWSKQQSGLVLSAFFCGYFLSQVIGGHLADHIGGVKVVIWAGLVWSSCTLITPIILEIYQTSHFISPTMTMMVIILTRVIMGIAQGVHFPSVSSITSKHCDAKDRSLIYSTIVAGAHVGTIFSGSIGSYILENVGWPAVFYTIGVFGMSWTLCMRIVSYRLIKLRGLLTSNGDDSLLLEKSPSFEKIPGSNEKLPWKVLFSTLSVWSIIIAHFCENTAFFILLSWLPSYFSDRFPTAKGWVYNVVPWMAVFPMCVLGGFIANILISANMSVTYVRKVLETFALLGCAFFIYLLQYTDSYFGSLFCLTAALAINGFHNSGVLVNPQDIAPHHAGAVFGIMNMAGALPGVFGVYLAGWMLTNKPHDWSGVFHLISTVLCFGWFVFTAFGTGRQII